MKWDPHLSEPNVLVNQGKSGVFPENPGYSDVMRSF
jgi:hypothetical protein